MAGGGNEGVWEEGEWMKDTEYQAGKGNWSKLLVDCNLAEVKLIAIYVFLFRFDLRSVASLACFFFYHFCLYNFFLFCCFFDEYLTQLVNILPKLAFFVLFHVFFHLEMSQVVFKLNLAYGAIAIGLRRSGQKLNNKILTNSSFSSLASSTRLSCIFLKASKFFGTLTWIKTWIPYPDQA